MFCWLMVSGVFRVSLSPLRPNVLSWDQPQCHWMCSICAETGNVQRMIGAVNRGAVDHCSSGDNHACLRQQFPTPEGTSVLSISRLLSTHKFLSFRYAIILAPTPNDNMFVTACHADIGNMAVGHRNFTPSRTCDIECRVSPSRQHVHNEKETIAWMMSEFGQYRRHLCWCTIVVSLPIREERFQVPPVGWHSHTGVPDSFRPPPSWLCG
jgi:hypothetical protein